MGLRRVIVPLLLTGTLLQARAQCDGLTIDSVVPADTSVCSGATVQLEVFGEFTDSTAFQWQELIDGDWSDMLNDSDSVLIIVPTDTTFYRLLAICPDDTVISDTVRVSIRPLPSATNSGDATSCGTPADTIFFFFSGGEGPWQAHFNTPGGPVNIQAAEDTFDIPFPDPGSYFLDSLIMAGCSGLELGGTLLVTIVEPPSAEILSPDTTICSEDAANLVTNDPAGNSGVWTINGTPDPLVSVTSPTTATFGPAGPDEYLIYWTVSAAGCPSDSDSVLVTVVGASDPAHAGEDANICAGNTIVLTGSDPDPGTGLWTVLASPSGAPDPIAVPTAANSLFAPGMNGSYTLLWTVANTTCGTTQDTVVIQVIGTAATPAILDFGDTEACDGEYQTLVIENPISGTAYTWSCPEWAVSPITSDTVTVQWEFPADSTSAFISVVSIVASGTCPDTTPLEVHLSPAPASCPRGIVYFEPYGLAVLDATANYFQWGTLDADLHFVMDSARTGQSTFDPEHISGCEPYYVARTSIDGTQCWSTTIACATQETIEERVCPSTGGMAEGPDVRIYPNPSHGGPVTLEAIGSPHATLNIDVSDLNGRLLRGGALPVNGTSTMTLELDGLDRGIYFLRARNPEMDRTIKLVID